MTSVFVLYGGYNQWSIFINAAHNTSHNTWVTSSPKMWSGLTILIYTNFTWGIPPEHYFVYNEFNFSRQIGNYELLFRDAIPLRYYLRFGDWRGACWSYSWASLMRTRTTVGPTQTRQNGHPFTPIITFQPQPSLIYTKWYDYRIEPGEKYLLIGFLI